MTEAPRPPAHLAPYVEVLGPDDAAAFLLRFGGAECYFTTSARGGSAVAQMVGVERARALAQALGSLKVRVPTGKPWLAAHLATKGLPVAEIARRLRVTDVTVRRLLRVGPEAGPRGRRDPRQLTLI